MAKILISGPISKLSSRAISFDPNLDPKNVFRGFHLDIVASYHCMQFQGKLMIQTQEDGENPHFGPDLDLLRPNSGHEIFSKIWLCQSLDIMISYHYVQYKKKTKGPILRKLSDGRTDGRTDRWTDRRTDGRTRVIS